jgi:hypothetical protein
MHLIVLGIVMLAFSALGCGDISSSQDDERVLSDDEVRQVLIEASIEAYEDNCPCPYNLAADGSQCGKRSAYDRTGGAEPLCFAADVSAALVRDYRESHR